MDVAWERLHPRERFEHLSRKDAKALRKTEKCGSPDGLRPGLLLNQNCSPGYAEPGIPRETTSSQITDDNRA
jgi:hypothetical protein